MTHVEQLICPEVHLAHVRVGLTAEVAPMAAAWKVLESVILTEATQRRSNLICRPLYVVSKEK